MRARWRCKARASPARVWKSRGSTGSQLEQQTDINARLSEDIVRVEAEIRDVHHGRYRTWKPKSLSLRRHINGIRRVPSIDASNNSLRPRARKSPACTRRLRRRVCEPNELTQNMPKRFVRAPMRNRKPPKL